MPLALFSIENYLSLRFQVVKELRMRFFGTVFIGLVWLGVSSSLAGIQPVKHKWLGSDETPQLQEIQTKGTLATQLEQLNFTFSFPGVEATEVETEIGSFTRLSSPDAGTTRETGALELPVFRKLLYLEPGRAYSCSASVVSSSLAQSWQSEASVPSFIWSAV